ncbi:MAG: hypothetical protein IJS67_02340, partial [Clostridia bacterium]|nr:hypothetical protein [Clostridia bacterium]
KLPIRTILKISMYSLKYLEKAPYAVVDNAVELVKKLGKGGAAGFVNAFLRKYQSAQISLPKEKVKNLSVLYSYPEFAVEKLLKGYGEERAKKIMSADEETTTIRFNSGVDGEKYLTEKGVNFAKTPFENTFIAKNFKRNEDYDRGIYTFQSIGSVAICDLAGSGESLLDACAAPGGKSVNLADKYGKVTSFELHPHRVRLIEEYASRMKKANISALQKDASVYDGDYQEKFDCVLVDAPCSGFGVVKDNPDIKLRRTEKNIEELSEIQYKILSCAANYVKKGGTLLYSTCSIFKEENSKVCLKFLSSCGNFKEVKCESPLPHLPSETGITFLPDISFGAGFYCCKFIKV